MFQSMGWQIVGHDLATEQQQHTLVLYKSHKIKKHQNGYLEVISQTP